MSVPITSAVLMIEERVVKFWSSIIPDMDRDSVAFGLLSACDSLGIHHAS